MKRIFLALLLVSALVAAGCTGVFDKVDDAKGKLRVGIVFDIGGKDDKSFNAAAWEGVVRAAKDFPDNIHLRDVEPGDPSSIEPSMLVLAERNYDLIIGIGFAQAPIMQNVARAYPNVKFAIIDGVIDMPNVASLLFREHEGSFLVGMIAASISKTNKVGFVGGMDIPLIHRFETGYAEGARYANPKVEVFKNYVGVTDGAWNNPGKGKELAKAQIERGADIIFQAAGNSGLGVFDAAEESSNPGDASGAGVKYAIGVDSNQNWVKPGFILTSMVKRVDVAVYNTVKELVEGRFNGGIHLFGLNNDGVGYALDQYNEKAIPPAVLDAVERARQDIIAGRIKVTDAMAK
ncbi:MAG TPA: BMP family ABC transporter substrate-binding protein [Blastocatellia bacterium]|nr:BMP family ABC transporter substrate-binding protein [Blastocatellia bacterium]